MGQVGPPMAIYYEIWPKMAYLGIAQIDSALFKKGLPLPSASDPGSDVVFETLMVSGSLSRFLSFGSEEIFTCVIKQIKKHCYHLKNISQNS